MGRLLPTHLISTLACLYLTQVRGLNYYNDEISKKEAPKVAIVGGGIGGTASAYYLSKLFKNDIMIDLYESNVIGGRISSEEFAGDDYEVGGTILHPSNAHMEEFLHLLGLSKNKGHSSSAGIFNGKSYDVLESSFTLVNIFKLFWRYGLDIYKLKSLNDEMLENFKIIYSLQEDGDTFTNVDDLLNAMDSRFPGMCRISTREYFEKQNLSPMIINELITAVTRGNYVQMPTVHAFLGSISVAAADPSLWSVQGGNKQIPEGLLKVSKAKHQKRRVTKIAVHSDGGFEVYSDSASSVNLHFEGIQQATHPSFEERSHIYDAVIIAAPLTSDKTPVKLLNFTRPLTFPGNYQRFVCTLVQGKPNPYTFRQKEFGVVEEVLTDEDLYYFIRARVPTVDGVVRDTPIYKVFSTKPLTENDLKNLFQTYSDVQVHDWLAVPEYNSVEELGDFELVPGLYYNNIIEKAGSAMEMSAIAAKNSAMLAYKHLTGELIMNSLLRDEL